MKLLQNISIKALASLLAIVSITNAAQEEAIADPNSAVVKLTSETFSKFIEENPLVLAEFFAPWCGHCKALGPHFSEAADTLEPKNIKLAQIDCTEEKELCTSHGIQGYPTLKVFRGSESNPSDYEGPRSADGIVSYMIKKSSPAVSVLDTDADVSSFLEEHDTAVIIGTGVKFNETFYQLAESNRDELLFVQTTDATFVKKYGENKFLIFLPDEEKPITYTGKNDLKTLNQWVNNESTPYFGELNGSTYSKYAESDLPLAYLFYNTPEERADFEETIVKLAKENRGNINFVGLDASKFGRHAENLNIKQEFPAFVIHDLANNKKFAVSQDVVLSKKKIIKFIDKFIKGEVEPIVKTEEIPEVQENNVYKIVGKNHDEIINDETRDVFVKYYAPWCGHCKRLAPIFEELADLYASSSEANDKIRIANIDATLNDVDVEIKGYPTLVLYPANDKSNPVFYQDGRDLKSLVKFIKEKGSYAIDADELEADIPQEKKKEKEEKEEVTHDEL